MNTLTYKQNDVADMQYYIDMDERYRSSGHLMAKKLNLILTLLRPGSRLIDIGCGTGELLLRASEKFQELVGIDNNDNAINFALRKTDKFRKIKLINRKDCKIPFPDEYFDNATCLDVLEHMRDSRDCLLEIWRVLKPHSQLIVTVPNWYDIINVRFFNRNSFHLQTHSPYRWINILESAGFRKITWRTVDFPIFHSELLSKHLAILGMCVLILLEKKDKKE
jgi:SAM-dependent methyltransferase